MHRLSLFLVLLNTFSCSTFAQTDTSKELIIFTYVEQMPEFKGDVQKYLSENIVYPQQALKQEIEGRVFVKFIVKETGEIDSVRVPKPGNPLFDVEAIRVISNMPRWKPGRQNGRKVNVRFMLPVSFRLPDE